MFDLIASILAWIYQVVGDLGWSIVLLTLVVMVVMTPLTLSGTKSMIKMQRLQPELRKIQQKHKNDREKMNAEMMAFYQENGVNPVGGCLPLFFQLPVFLVLYRVLQGLTRRRVLDGSWEGSATELVSGDLAGVQSPDDLGLVRNFNPQYLDESSELFVDLSTTDEIPFFFGIFDLSLSPLEALRGSIVEGIPYLIMVLVVLGTSLYQQRQIQGRNPNAMANPQQAALMKIMPWFLPVISFSLQSALILYFVTSNVYRIGQQGYITRTLYKDGPPTVVDVDSTKKGGNGASDKPAEKGGGAGSGATQGKGSSKGTNKANDKKAKKQPQKKQQAKKTSSSSGSGGKGRRGAGAGRPDRRETPAPSSRTGGNQQRSAKNRKKKRR